ncbi:DoxX family membrane protein [Streptomyces sp. ID05-26A]|nr:DoxX family membrane protein [Streptomyces sp. ID05-26A]
MTALATAPAATVRKSAAARHATLVTRVLTGLLFTTTGLNGWLNFMPAPDPGTMAPEAVAFTAALAATGYMLHLASVVQVLAGVLLLTGRFVPLALALLAPMIVNIVLYHVFLETEGIAVGLFVTIAVLGLAWAHRDEFRPMLRAR